MQIEERAFCEQSPPTAEVLTIHTVDLGLRFPDLQTGKEEVYLGARRAQDGTVRAAGRGPLTPPRWQSKARPQAPAEALVTSLLCSVRWSNDTVGVTCWVPSPLVSLPANEDLDVQRPLGN